jgi:hypothetical protein
MEIGKEDVTHGTIRQLDNLLINRAIEIEMTNRKRPSKN